MKKVHFQMMLASGALVLGMAAIWSAALWAIWGAAWWMPMEDGPPVRGLALWALHIASGIVGICGFAWWVDEIDRRFY